VKKVKKKYADSSMLAVGSFFVVRFLCPALLLPEKYGLADKSQMTMHTRKLSMLASWLLQSFSRVPLSSSSSATSFIKGSKGKNKAVENFMFDFPREDYWFVNSDMLGRTMKDIFPKVTQFFSNLVVSLSLSSSSPSSSSLSSSHPSSSHLNTYSLLQTKSLSRSPNLNKEVTKCLKRTSSKLKGKQRTASLRVIFSFLVANRTKVLLVLDSAEKVIIPPFPPFFLLSSPHLFCSHSSHLILFLLLLPVILPVSLPFPLSLPPSFFTSLTLTLQHDLSEKLSMLLLGSSGALASGKYVYHNLRGKQQSSRLVGQLNFEKRPRVNSLNLPHGRAARQKASTLISKKGGTTTSSSSSSSTTFPTPTAPRYTCVDPAILLSSLEKEISELSKSVEEKIEEKNSLKVKLRELRKEDASRTEAIAELNSTIEILQRALSSAAPFAQIREGGGGGSGTGGRTSPTVISPSSSFSQLPDYPMPTSSHSTSYSSSYSTVPPTSSSTSSSSSTSTTTTTTATTATVSLPSSPITRPAAVSNRGGTIPTLSIPISVPENFGAPIPGSPLSTSPGSIFSSDYSPPPSARAAPRAEEKHTFDELLYAEEVPEALALFEEKGTGGSSSSNCSSSTVISPYSSPISSLPTTPTLKRSSSALPLSSSSSTGPTSIIGEHQRRENSIVQQQQQVQTSKTTSSSPFSSPESSGNFPMSPVVPRSPTSSSGYLSNREHHPTHTSSGSLIPLPLSPSSSGTLPQVTASSSPSSSVSSTGGTLKRAIGKTIRDRMKVFEKSEEEEYGNLSLEMIERLLSEPEEDFPQSADMTDEAPLPEEKPPDINKTIMAPSLKKTFYGKKVRAPLQQAFLFFCFFFFFPSSFLLRAPLSLLCSSYSSLHRNSFLSFSTSNTKVLQVIQEHQTEKELILFRCSKSCLLPNLL
jgi:hypothetical protein